VPSALACSSHHGGLVIGGTRRGWIRLPPTPQGLIQLHDVEQFIGSDACQLQFSVEEPAFRLGDVGGSHAEPVKPIGIDPQLHAVFPLAQHKYIADPGDTGQSISDIEFSEVTGEELILGLIW
jgi:hypothetical protein